MKTDYIKPQDYNKLFMIMQYENALAMKVSLETGLRIGDVLHLRPEDIRERHIEIIAQKTGKAVKKPISADLSKRLSQICGARWVFEGRSGSEPKTRAAVWKDVKKACKLLGIECNVGCHSARKTYAVELYNEKGIAAVQKELQHDNLETTMLYAFANLLRSGVKLEAETEKTDSDYGEDLAEMIADRVVEKINEIVSNNSFRLTSDKASSNIEAKGGEHSGVSAVT